jgi:hypothetical protein
MPLQFSQPLQGPVESIVKINNACAFLFNYTAAPLAAKWESGRNGLSVDRGGAIETQLKELQS